MTFFSSQSALFGSGGQISYAVANSWGDAWVQMQSTSGTVALSVQWGAWANVGMASNLHVSMKARIERMKLREIEPGDALRDLSDVVATDHGFLGPGVLSHILLKGSATLQEMLNSFKSTHLTEESTSSPVINSSLVDKRYERPHPEGNFLEKTVKQTLSTFLGKDVVADDPIFVDGVDSLSTIELRNTLEKELGLQLPSTLLFDYPTTKSLLDYISESFVSEGVADTHKSDERYHEVPHSLLSSQSKEDPICVTGLKVILQDEYLSGAIEDCVSPVPLSRWETGDGSVNYGAFIPSIWTFCAEMFGISPFEAKVMDVQQHLLMTSSCSISHLLERDFNVFVGVSNSDFTSLCQKHGTNVASMSVTGAGLSVCGGRLSYVYDLVGQCVTIDTACSSSLVGTHLSYTNAISTGNGALTCGVNVILSMETHYTFLAASMLAPDGRCKT